MTDKNRSLFSEEFNTNNMDKKNDHYILVKDFGAKGDGVTNDTAIIQKIVDLAKEGSTIVFESGKTYFLNSITSTKSLNINFNGAKIIADPTTSGTNGSPLFWFKGTIGTAYDLTSCTDYSNTVTLTLDALASGFLVGDFVTVSDNKFVPIWDGGANNDPSGSVGYAGRSEVNRIKSISGSVVTLSKPIEWSYDTNPKLTKITKMLKSPKIYGASEVTEIDPLGVYSGALTGSVPHIFHFQYCFEPSVEDCHVNKFQLHCVNFYHCLSPSLLNCSAKDPFRPASGGHGYFSRFEKCSGGVASNNHTTEVRHAIDYVTSYDGYSSHNYALNPFNVAYFMHGLGSKRCTSDCDTVVGNTNVYGWAMGNPAFNADYDFTIINPTYTAKNGIAIICQTNSVGMRVISPKIKTETRGIQIVTGASDVEVRGGKIEVTGSDTAGVAIMARSKSAFADAFGIPPKNISIVGLKLKNNAPLSLEVEGYISVTDNTFELIATGSIVSASVFIATEAVQDVDISDNKFLGTYRRAIQVNVEPTRNCLICRNFIDNGYTVLGISLVSSTKLRLIDNYVLGSSQLSFSGTDIYTSIDGGALLINNVPNTYDRRLTLTSKELNITGIDTELKGLFFKTGLLNRWIVRTTGGTESGSNVGNNIEILARADDGSALSTPLLIDRATGNIQMTSGQVYMIGNYLKPLKLSNGYLFIDTTGKLRTKSGSVAPSSDTDGILNSGLSGTTAARPSTSLYAGMPYFDTTLGKPIWRNAANTAWTDSAGTTV